jgi:hypothetical protein
MLCLVFATPLFLPGNQCCNWLAFQKGSCKDLLPNNPGTKIKHMLLPLIIHQVGSGESLLDKRLTLGNITLLQDLLIPAVLPVTKL